jgi:signal transduction histidine kinase
MKVFRLILIISAWCASDIYAHPFSEFHTQIDTSQVHSLIEEGQQANRNGELEKAEYLLKKADSLSKAIDYGFGKEKAILHLADFYDDKAEYAKAIQLIEEAIANFPESSLMAHYYNTLASSYFGQSEFDKALSNFENAIEYLQLLPDDEEKRLHAGILQNIATIYQDKGERVKAFENYLAAIEYAEAAKDSIFLTIAYNNIGQAYNDSEEFETSLYYLEKALEFAKAKNSQIDIYRASLNMANTLSNMARYEEALGLYEIAGELFSKLRPNIPPAIILHNRGATLAQMKRYSEAEELLLESLRITNDMGILQGVYFNHHILGNMYFEQGRSEEAVYHLENAIDAAEEIGNMQQAQTSRDVLHKTYAQANRFKKAYESLNDFKIYSDSLTNIVKEKELAELESRLELIRQSEFNRLLEEKQVQQEQQLNFQFYLIIAAIVVIVLVVVILFIMRKSAREREEINSKLQQQKLELEELGHAKDKLFAIITHDLRSPLTSLQGILHLIKDNVLSNQDMAELIPELEVSIQKNVDVMDDLLQWAKEQLSGVKMNIKPVNIHQIVDEIISSQSFIAQKKGVTVKQEIPKEETVMADVNALQLVIRNLISNSIKFTSRGDEVQVILHSNHAHTQLVIKDTGIGIPKEAADKIFDSKSWTRPGTNKEKGSGFGLSLSKEFVERMGGRIWFESEDGKGSTFYIELPKG